VAVRYGKAFCMSPGVPTDFRTHNTRHNTYIPYGIAAYRHPYLPQNLIPNTTIQKNEKNFWAAYDFQDGRGLGGYRGLHFREFRFVLSAVLLLCVGLFCGYVCSLLLCFPVGFHRLFCKLQLVFFLVSEK